MVAVEQTRRTSKRESELWIQLDFELEKLWPNKGGKFVVVVAAEAADEGSGTRYLAIT